MGIKYSIIGEKEGEQEQKNSRTQELKKILKGEEFYRFGKWR
jgi:hypothetical protein